MIIITTDQMIDQVFNLQNPVLNRLAEKVLEAEGNYAADPSECNRNAVTSRRQVLGECVGHVIKCKATL